MAFAAGCGEVTGTELDRIRELVSAGGHLTGRQIFGGLARLIAGNVAIASG